MPENGPRKIKSTRLEGRIRLAWRYYLIIGAVLGTVPFVYNIFHLPDGSWDLIADGYPSVMAIATLVYSLGLHLLSACLRAVLWLPSLIWYIFIEGAAITGWIFYAV